jgi:ribosome-associated toxin RatA of RatAB toxin-antitoxin module
MPTLDISCDDMVVADPAYVAERLGSDTLWREWWPELTLTPSERRGAEGVRWAVTGAAIGTAEWWLERVRDGVVVHWYLRVDPARPVRGRALTRLRERYVTQYRERLWAFKDEAETGRAAGERRTGDQPAIVSRSEQLPTVQSRQQRGESMAEQTTSTIVVNATPKEIMAVIADFAAYPEWADSMRETQVLSTDEAGRPKQVRFKVDAGAISDEYTLDYVWSRNEVTWTLVEAKMVKGMDGAYVLRELGPGSNGGTEVTYRLAVDIAIPMIGMLKRKAEKVIIDTALKGLKKRVES